jgi:Fe-S-cluster containining protein
MSAQPDILVAARDSLQGAHELQRLPHAVMRFHARVDAMLEETHRNHAVEVACKRGCSLCCHMQVEILPPEAFALAEWLKRHRTPAQLASITARLADNARRTRELGIEGRKRANIACALLGDDGACTAYEARPAQCRRFHSTDLARCESSYARPEDDSILSPAHPAVAHNAQVVVTVAQHGLRDRGLDATAVDMNLALATALEDPRAWRRWRDGKKAFVAAVVRMLALVPLVLGAMAAFELDVD